MLNKVIKKGAWNIDGVTFRLVLLTVIPLFALAVSLLTVYNRAIAPLTRTYILGSVRERNASESVLMEEWILEQQLIVQYLSTCPETRSWNLPLIERNVVRTAETFPSVNAVVVADTSGHVIIDSLGGSGGYIGDRAYFRRALAGDSVVQYLVRARPRGTPTIILAEPVRSPTGEIAGVLFAAVNPAFFSSVFKGHREDLAFQSFLADHHGYVITGTDAGSFVSPENRPTSDLTASYINFAEIEVYGIENTLSGVNWSLVTELPVTRMTELSNQYNWTLLHVFLLALSTSIVAALIIGITIRSPILQLDRMAITVGNGTYTGLGDRRSMNLAPPELHLLRDTFVRMAEIITRRQQELKESNSLLMETQSIAHLGSWKYDPGTGLVRCSEESFRLMGLSPDNAVIPVRTALAELPIEDRRLFITRFFKSLRTHEEGFEMEHRIVNSVTGEERVVFQKCIHIRDSAGALRETRGMVHDITERHQFERSLKSAIYEKTVLLQEVHHRVRNNLSIIRSLVSLKRDRLQKGTEAYDVMTDTYHRVSAMALMHDQLNDRGNAGQVDLADYIQFLLQEVQVSYGAEEISFRTELEPIMVDLTIGIPCGIIMNELVVNVFKHAFPWGKGLIHVSMTRQHEMVRLVIADNGIGLPADHGTSGGLGNELLEQLALQIRGQITFNGRNGTEVIVEFPGSHQ
jgi:two-component sensor histidine kinase/PAS domain-containing protein